MQPRKFDNLTAEQKLINFSPSELSRYGTPTKPVAITECLTDAEIKAIRDVMYVQGLMDNIVDYVTLSKTPRSDKKTEAESQAECARTAKKHWLLLLKELPDNLPIVVDYLGCLARLNEANQRLAHEGFTQAKLARKDLTDSKSVQDYYLREGDSIHRLWVHLKKVVTYPEWKEACRKTERN